MNVPLDSYLILAKPFTIEEEIKKSRFITVLFPCQSESDLKLALTNLRTGYPDARHYCYAFVAGQPDDTVHCGSTDDGEPSGSAGRPMLSVLQGSNIGEIGVVVIRYFGGTKLGVGGLVRAYSGGIKRSLPQLELVRKQIRVRATIVCDYAQLGDVEYLLKRFDGVIVDKSFTAQVKLVAEIPVSTKKAIADELATLTQGRLAFQFVD
ncbi:YigZ family protein [Parashewanella spongiae]|uniref:YigZ family protein n=1 Tax=Parashewanella spongiae TaxID=342950 RepID=A0A3A6U0L6_9GAMM|nr:YigZ family protein [Parashewanella spongiae]MCL1077849.1 YigZ family protein [Parashewanella spongiae]RJY17630.1 YigZ family protein [Parashewanella spongiae]